VPESTRALTHAFQYNQIETLDALFKKHPGEFAAVILEPMNTTFPKEGFLEEVKKLTHTNGALLVFDETITGFRFANGGAQEYFGVTPDLATFGKGLANGYPVSAVCGRADVMKLMEEVFFSFTFGGETLSLAAAKATLEKLQREPVIETLWKRGKELFEGVNQRIKKHGLEGMISLVGSNVWSFLVFKDTTKYSQWQIKTLFLQEVFARGILTFGTHNMSYAHTAKDLKQLFDAYDEIFPLLRDAVEQGTLESLLKCKPLEPLFKVR
jgi:glutamate-1-semialdehyde 2,1-aminomutase